MALSDRELLERAIVVLEMTVDTRRCSIAVQRTMNDIRARLAEPEVRWLGGVISDSTGEPICEIVFNADMVQALRDENEKLRGLLGECIPKLMGAAYDYSDTRICRECGYYSGHDEDCLVRRVREALK